MRLLTTAAMALALAASAAAASADPQNNNQPPKDTSHAGAQGGQGGHSGGQGGQGQHGGSGGAGSQGGARGGPPPLHASPRSQTLTTQGGPTPGSQGGRGFNGQGGASGQVRGGGASVQAFVGVRGGVPGAGQQLRGRDQGRAWFRPGLVPQQFSAQQRFHVGWSNRPNGWYARRWVFGDFLPWGWFAPGYYLDFADYGLPYPPIGCEWVREGPDAVLVNVWTGQVLSVAYGMFW